VGDAISKEMISQCYGVNVTLVLTCQNEFEMRDY